MTRKRRLTRSRQQRKAITKRTRQTLAQAHRRCLEAEYEAVLNPSVHPFLVLYRRKAKEAVAMFPGRLIPIIADPLMPENEFEIRTGTSAVRWRFTP